VGFSKLHKVLVGDFVSVPKQQAKLRVEAAHQSAANFRSMTVQKAGRPLAGGALPQNQVGTWAGILKPVKFNALKFGRGGPSIPLYIYCYQYVGL